MEVHHLLKREYNNCLYCDELLSDEWESYHHDDFHYKQNTCTSCGNVTSVRVDFLGSGHDRWSQMEKKVLENEKEVHNEIKKRAEKLLEQDDPHNVLLGKLVHEFKHKVESKTIKEIFSSMQ